MNFPLNAYLLALLSAAFCSALAVPFWRGWCRRVGLLDDPGERKIHTTPIPLAGGLAVLTGLCLPPLVAAGVLFLLPAGHDGGLLGQLAQPLAHGFRRRAVELTAILGGAFGMVALGLLDDKFELRPRTKFAGQLLIALGVAAAGARVTVFVPSPVFSYAVTVLWILTVTNALNFMDNMNGLCAGIGALGALAFAGVAIVAGQYLVAMMALLAGGALLGFLPYNFPRASVFLGDAGSHLVGYLLAVLGILPHFYTALHPRRLAVLTPLLVLAVPLIDLLWVVAFRWRKGKPFYVGDTNHLSHQLVRRGWSKPAAVLLLWLAAAFAGGLALL